MWRKSKYLASPPEVPPRVLELLGYLLVELGGEVHGQRLVSFSDTDAIAETLLRSCRSNATVSVGQ